MKKTTRRLLAVAMAGVLALSLFCTISDNNGNPIDPGEPDGPTIGGGRDTVGGADTARGSGTALTPDIDAPSVMTVGIDDTVTVEVWLFADASSNEPLVGKTINISVGRDGDWVSANSKRTDAAGKVEVKFSSPTEGKATLTFTYSASAGRNVTSTATILVTDNPTRRIFITASPTVLAADGASKSTITAQVKNDNNNPIAGDVIVFSSTAGFITAQGTTDADGKATAYLTSDKRNDTATVKAWLKSNVSLSETVKVEFSGVTLSASALPETIKPSGGDSTVILAVLRDAANNPIVNEKIVFSKEQAQTMFIKADSTTNNRGEARCVLKSTAASNGEWITVRAAGAETKVFITYSSQILTITPANDNQYYAGKKNNYSTFTVRYTQGNGTTALPNAVLRVTVTMGTLAELTDPDNPSPSPLIIFADEFALAGEREWTFTMNNPDFTGLATVYVKGLAGGSSAVDSKQIYFRSGGISRIAIVGSPAVIGTFGTNNDISKISATAYDEFGNRVNDRVISFNVVKGPGGGEYLNPPTATTGIDGVASTNLIAGTIPSLHKDVWVVASDYDANRSDTVKLTIAGPPRNISVTAEIEKFEKGPATYIRPLVALVSDINHNPVPDGTEVTFITVVPRVPGYTLFPPPVVILTRTVLTENGVANNKLIYGQLEANEAVDDDGKPIYEALVAAECQGVVSEEQHVPLGPPPKEVEE